jgi:hypothetical protein
MVDSLFRPADNAAAGSSLLTGLQGLSINNKEMLTSLWGTSSKPTGGRGLNGFLLLGVGLALEQDNPLFSMVNSSLAATKQKTQS